MTLPKSILIVDFDRRGSLPDIEARPGPQGRWAHGTLAKVRGTQSPPCPAGGNRGVGGGDGGARLHPAKPLLHLVALLGRPRTAKLQLSCVGPGAAERLGMTDEARVAGNLEAAHRPRLNGRRGPHLHGRAHAAFSDRGGATYAALDLGTNNCRL